MAMAEGRQYEVSLVDAIGARTRTIALEGAGLDGLSLEVRPVPDDDREHAMDPRVFEMARRRLSGATATPGINDVISMRERPNKESHAIDDGSVTERVALMNLGDRLIPLHIFEPQRSSTGSVAVLAYFHGGGFTVGNVGQFRNPLRLIAQLSGCVVTYTEYRLAPECPYPAGVEDCSGTVDWLCEHAKELGIDPERIAVAGDSAGGSLSNAVAQLQAGRGRVKLVMEMYPLTDAGPVPAAWSYDLYPMRDEQRVEAKSRVDRFKNPGDSLAETYAMGSHEVTAGPLVSALNCRDFSVFPRTVVITADYDYLRYQGELFAKRLLDAGVSVRAIRYAGCDHGFFETCGVLPQVEDLCRVMAGELSSI